MASAKSLRVSRPMSRPHLVGGRLIGRHDGGLEASGRGGGNDGVDGQKELDAIGFGGLQVALDGVDLVPSPAIAHLMALSGQEGVAVRFSPPMRRRSALPSRLE